MSDRNKEPASLSGVFIDTIKRLFTVTGGPRRSKDVGLDMEDVNYLIDMDGVGLCFHEIYKSKQAFKKQ